MINTEASAHKTPVSDPIPPPDAVPEDYDVFVFHGKRYSVNKMAARDGHLVCLPSGGVVSLSWDPNMGAYSARLVPSWLATEL